MAFSDLPDTTTTTTTTPDDTATVDTPVLTSELLRGVVAAVSLIHAWQNRRERHNLIAMAIEHGILPPPPEDGVVESKEDAAARVAATNDLNALLASVPTLQE